MGRLIVTIATRDGRTLFVGSVPEDDVKIVREPNRPSTATVRMPLTDLLGDLRAEPVRVHPLEELLRRLWDWIGFGRAGRGAPR